MGVLANALMIIIFQYINQSNQLAHLNQLYLNLKKRKSPEGQVWQIQQIKKKNIKYTWYTIKLKIKKKIIFFSMKQLLWLFMRYIYNKIIYCL